MADQIYKYELPDGRVFEIESPVVPTPETVKKVAQMHLGVESQPDLSGRPVEAGAAGFAQAVAPSTAFLGTMGAASAALKPLGKVASIGGGLIAGAGAAALARIIQDGTINKLNPKLAAYLKKLAVDNEIATIAGEMVGSGFKPGGIDSNLTKEFVQRAFPAALGAGMQAGGELLAAPKGEIMGEGAGGRIAQSAGINALLKDPTKAGSAIINAGSRLGAAFAKKPIPITTKVDAVVGGAKTPSEAEALANKNLVFEAQAAQQDPSLRGGRDVVSTPDVQDDVVDIIGKKSAKFNQEVPKSDLGRMGQDAVDSPDLPEPQSDLTGMQPVEPKGNITQGLADSIPHEQQNSEDLWGDTVDMILRGGDDRVSAIKKSADARATQENLISLGLNAEQSAQIFDAAFAQRLKDAQDAANGKRMMEAARLDQAKKDNSKALQPEKQLEEARKKAVDDALAADEAEAARQPNYAGAENTGTIGELIGKKVWYYGYEGILTLDRERNINVVVPAAKKGQNIVEVEGTGKNLDTKAKDVGVKPLSGILPQDVPFSIAEPALGALIGKGAARLTDQDEETEKKWTALGFGIGHLGNRLALPYIKKGGFVGDASNLRAVAGGGKKEIAPAKYLGRQLVGDKPGPNDLELWNLTQDIPGHPKGSTVTSNTLKKAGFEVPEIPQTPLHAGITGQRATSAAAGGIAGYMTGDDEYEKWRNAGIGALAGAAAPSLLKGGSRLAKGLTGPGVAKNATPEASGPKVKSHWDEMMAGVGEKGVKPRVEGGTSPTTVQSPESSYRYSWHPLISKYLGDAGKVLKKAIGSPEDNVMSINKRVGGVLREYQGFIDNLRAEWSAGPEKFFADVRKSLTPQELEEFDYRVAAFGESGTNHARAEEILASKPNGKELVEGFRQAKKVYSDMAESQRAVGREVNELEDAWPRQMLDYNEFRKELSMEERTGLENALAIKEKEKGSPLNDIEKSEIINSAISLTLRGKPTFLKERTVKGLDQNQFKKLYQPFDVAFANRIARVSADVARRKYLGHDSPEDASLWDEKSGDFGKIITEELKAGRIPDEGHDVIISNLKDLLHQETQADNAMIRLGNKISRAQNLLFLGDLTSSVAQFGDIFVDLFAYGAKATGKGYFAGATGGSRIKLKDLGLGSNTFQETQQFGREASNTKMKKASDWVVSRMVGMADAINKEGLVNSARASFISALKDESSRDFIRYNKRYSEMFPDRWPEMLKDLKSKDFADGKLNNNTRFFLYNELSRFQPVSMSQRAQAESAVPSIRWMYSLKRYWIKQLGLLRMEGYEKIKDQSTRNEGLKNLAFYAGLVSLGQGLAVGTLKDVLFGRDVELEENAVQGLAQVMGISRYTMESARREGPVKAFAGMVSPLGQVGMDVYKDYGTLVNNTGDSLRSTKYVPVGGKLYNAWFGSGVEGNEKAQKKRIDELKKGGSNSPTIDELGRLLLPDSPKHRR